MKLSAAFMILGDIFFIFTTGVLPTLKYIWRTPSLLFKPAKIRKLIMSFVWVEMGNGIDQNLKIAKTALITPNAYGVVLDLGSGKHSRIFLIISVIQLVHLRIRPYCQLYRYWESNSIYCTGAQSNYASRDQKARQRKRLHRVWWILTHPPLRRRRRICNYHCNRPTKHHRHSHLNSYPLFCTAATTNPNSNRPHTLEIRWHVLVFRTCVESQSRCGVLAEILDADMAVVLGWM